MPRVRRGTPSRPPRHRLPRNLARMALIGAPVALAAGVAVGVLLSGWSQHRNPAHELPSAALSLSSALGLVVSDIEVDGRVTTDKETILAALGAHAGTPILAVSPSRAKEQLEALPWVRSASIERRLPGTLYVHLVERTPLAVWQHDGKQELIDRDGTVIPVTDLSRFAKLPTVVGDDDARHGAAAVIDMLASEPELAPRVTALVLVGERRWNLRIDNAIDVLLPDDEPGQPVGQARTQAWSRLASIERTTQLFQRDVQTVDMRLPDRLVMRVNDAPKDPSPAKKPHPGGKST